LWLVRFSTYASSPPFSLRGFGLAYPPFHPRETQGLIQREVSLFVGGDYFESSKDFALWLSISPRKLTLALLGALPFSPQRLSPDKEYGAGGTELKNKVIRYNPKNSVSL